MARIKDVFVGARFGRLVVIGQPQGSIIKVLCLCDCGKEHYVEPHSLGSSTNSCGCLLIDSVIERSITHKLSKTTAYRSWLGMIYRCTKPSRSDWDRYGGRGITVCDRWISVENFYEDMGDPPEGMTLDRIDNDGNYEPSNCRWATIAEQNVNKRSSRITIDQVLSIRERLARGERTFQIWRDYPDIPKSVIYDVCNGRTWRHLL